MEKFQKHFALILCAVTIICTGVVVAEFDGYSLTIGNPGGTGDGGTVAPYFFATMDAAGYSDWIYYGLSDVHNEDGGVYGYHEVLSGEWGAAIYYSDIDRPATIDPNDSPDRRQAMWLTKDFTYPDWSTGCDFWKPADKICDEWNNPNNDAPLMNTGQSTIRNNEVEITIDYEVVDLDGLDDDYSPMVFRIDPNNPETLSYVFSDRYIFLQTYTVKNIKAEALTNLEFYQFLHSHGADEYAARVNSTYSDIAISDPLSSYTPINPVHDVGNFRYDITQWNERPFGTASHVDYVGFSSTVAPDWIDNSYYEGGHSYDYYIPPRGTHHHIEDRLLNNAEAIYTAEVGGAMGWAMGSLDPNETTSLTIAFMFAPEQDSPSLWVTKTDNLDPNETVSPGDEITYTICWENIGLETAENAVLTEFLPAGVTYPEGWDRFDPNFVIIPADPNYDQGNHTYTWQLDDISSDEGGCVSLDVVVNEQAEPGMLMRNETILSTSLGDAGARCDTGIDCWDTGGVIYVDAHATGYNTGTSWQRAYTDLQRALLRAAADCGLEIWVTQGTYDPGRPPSEQFTIPDNVSVYGGFKGDETSRDQRNPQQYKTILTGGADPELNNTVVKMGDNALLDGFTVTEGALYGIYGEGVDFTIENCTITSNSKQGLSVENGNAMLRWCKINNNTENGIRHIGAGSILTLENSKIVENNEYGIFVEYSTPTIKNCVISHNGFFGTGFDGITILFPTEGPVLYNNTIAYNANAGISWVDDIGSGVDPNVLDYPDIQNCILWYNNDGGGQVAGFDQDDWAYYCCIQDCNDVNSNISDEPGFAYEYSDDPNVMLNVHLAYDSPCIDMGNPNHDANDVGLYDVDAEDRIVDSRVDIGADEAYSCDDYLTADDIYHPLDWTADGIVNMHEYGIFAAAWLSVDPNNPLCDPNNPGYSDPNDPGYISEGDKLRYSTRCDIDDDMDVDMADFALLCDEWLWTACWKDSRIYRFEMMAMAMGGGESMMMGEPYAMESSTVDSGAIEGYQPPTLEQSVAAILVYINWYIEQNHSNTEALYDMKAFLEDTLKELRKKK